jgi:hypothetical protein
MPLDPQRVQAVFLEAADHHDLAKRAAILDRECNGDAELRQRVEALLKAHDRFSDFVNQPLAGPGGLAPRFYAVSNVGDRARLIASLLRRIVRGR